MKNYDFIKNATIEELIDEFEQYMETIPGDPCDNCPFTNMCSKGHNGFKAWLESER